MQPAFFSLILTAVHVCVLVDCRPRLQDPQPGSYHAATHADPPAGMRRFYSELSGSMKRGGHRDFLAVLPVRSDAGNFVSIFDLRRKRFLCMDLRGELYISKQKNKDDCLFQRIWLDLTNHRYVYYSMSGARLLKPAAPAHQEPPGSPALLERLRGPPVKRQRRSEEVNPSDPLRSQPHSAKDHKDASHGQPEQDQAGAVSKETISSCDDPLQVLQPNGPVSPVKTNIADRAEQD